MSVPIYITFLNYLGGFEYFLFTAEKEFTVNIQESQTTKDNIFPNWGKSWGETADTIEKKTFTKANEEIVFKSQHLTENQRDALKYIKVSTVVQIVYSRNDRRTIIVDSDSFKVYSEDQSLYTLQFRGKFTNEIPAQRL